MNARTSDASKIADKPATARVTRRRARIRANTSAMPADVIMAMDGVGTRRSARPNPPKPRTVPEMPCNATAVSSAGILARNEEI
jgi:hypothetical protein